MRITVGVAVLELDVDGGSVTLHTDEGGGVYLTGALVAYEVERAPFDGQPQERQELAEPVPVRVRVDGFALLHQTRRALFAKSRKSKAGPVTVSAGKPTWRRVKQ